MKTTKKKMQTKKARPQTNKKMFYRKNSYISFLAEDIHSNKTTERRLKCNTNKKHSDSKRWKAQHKYKSNKHNSNENGQYMPILGDPGASQNDAIFSGKSLIQEQEMGTYSY